MSEPAIELEYLEAPDLDGGKYRCRLTWEDGSQANVTVLVTGTAGHQPLKPNYALAEKAVLDARKQRRAVFGNEADLLDGMEITLDS